MRYWSKPAVLALVSLCCGHNPAGPPPPPPPPVPGQLRLQVLTSGTDLDANGYTVSVDGEAAKAIPVDTNMLVTGLTAGSHSVVFAGVAGNCHPAEPDSTSVSVASGATLLVKFDVACEPRLDILASTTGSDPDVEYLAGIDTGSWHLLDANGTVLKLAGVPAGAHSLRLAGIAPNCTLTGSASRPINVPADTIATVTVDVTCSATTRRILFGSTRDAGYDLYVMDANGANPVRITDSLTQPALHGAWSPDGARITYHKPAGATGYDIWVMNANGTGSVAITSDGSTGVINTFPQWSPDGRSIAFEKTGQIWVMDSSGANAHQVSPFGHDPRWSPDGNQIAFNDGSALYVMNADGSGTHIVQDVKTFYSAFPAWSPDGKKILFASPRDGAYDDIFVMNADGSGVVNLTHSPGGVLNEDFDWSPDGTKIAFRTNRDGGNTEIYVMNADGSNPIDISQNVWDEFGPAWHP
jgi:WD40 repeat protein